MSIHFCSAGRLLSERSIIEPFHTCLQSGTNKTREDKCFPKNGLSVGRTLSSSLEDKGLMWVSQTRIVE